jgi:hypothetical protein
MAHLFLFTVNIQVESEAIWNLRPNMLSCLPLFITVKWMIAEDYYKRTESNHTGDSP